MVGRPFLYATTKEFLIRFGLNDLADLPKVEDMAEGARPRRAPILVERAPPEELLPLEEPDGSGEDGERTARPRWFTGRVDPLAGPTACSTPRGGARGRARPRER